MAIFYSKQRIAQLLGVTETQFHREIKKIIKMDFKMELANMGVENPDILLDSNNIMTLADPSDHTIFFQTTVSIFDYI